MEKPLDQKNNQWSWKEFFSFAFLILIIVLPIRMFVAQPFVVSGASMEPVFHTGEYIIVDQLTYKIFHEPKRGDIVIFKVENPETHQVNKFLIKRIVGLPNEIIRINGHEISIKKPGEENFQVLEEDYINKPFQSFLEVEIKEDEFFVLGDNRSNSIDSRYFGSIEKSSIIGRAFLRLLPITEIDYLPGKFDI